MTLPNPDIAAANHDAIARFDYGWLCGRNAAIRDALTKMRAAYRDVMDDVADRREAWNKAQFAAEEWLRECEAELEEFRKTGKRTT